MRAKAVPDSSLCPQHQVCMPACFLSRSKLTDRSSACSWKRSWSFQPRQQIIKKVTMSYRMFEKWKFEDTLLMIPSKNVSRETKVCLVFYLISFNHPTK
jgi:hypothetical protein